MSDSNFTYLSIHPTAVPVSATQIYQNMIHYIPIHTWYIPTIFWYIPVFSCPPRSSTQPLSLAFLLSQPQLPSGATPSIHRHLMILLAGRCSAWPVRPRSSSLSRLRSNLPARSLPTPSQPPRPSSPRATTSSPGSPPPLQGPPPHRVIRARPTRTQIQIRSFSRFVKVIRIHWTPH